MLQFAFPWATLEPSLLLISCMISCAQIVTVVVDYAHRTEGVPMALRHGCRWVWMKTEEKKSPEAVATGLVVARGL